MRDKNNILYNIRPCINCSTEGNLNGCRIQVIKTESGSYRVGCVHHSVWQQKSYTTVEEAIDMWNKQN